MKLIRYLDSLEKLPQEGRTLILIGFIILVALIANYLARWLINRMLRKGLEDTPLDTTRLTFVQTGISVVIWLIALGGIVYTIPKLRSIAVTIFAGAGILIAVLGFAAQAAFSNIIGGIFLVIFKPFRIGDFIKVGSLDYGWVEDITLRHTTIRSFQNKRIIIPNSTVSGENIINDSIVDPRMCRFIDFSISYDSNIDKAIAVIQQETVKHPLCIDTRSVEDIMNGVPQVVVRVAELGDYFVKLRGFAWAKDSPDAIVMHQELNKIIKERFDREDIEIPFPYRTIVNKSDIPRRSGAGFKDKSGNL